MFKKDNEAIPKIDTRWAGSAIITRYFMPSRPNPRERLLEFATNASAIEFLGFFGTLMATDYQCAPREISRQMTIFDIIAHRTWIAADKAIRPLAIHLTIHTGHRMIFAAFHHSTESPKYRPSPIAQIEFLTMRDLLRAILFLDDLFEENSSSRENGIKKIKEYILARQDIGVSVVYTLKNPILSYNI